jgi:hypothetical protein
MGRYNIYRVNVEPMKCRGKDYSWRWVRCPGRKETPTDWIQIWSIKRIHGTWKYCKPISIEINRSVQEMIYVQVTKGDPGEETLKVCLKLTQDEHDAMFLMNTLS